jgi:glycerate kinase
VIRHLLNAKNPESYSNDAFIKLSRTAGTGASGGMVAAMLATFDKAQIISGMDFMNNVCKVEDRIRGVDIVITGEGSLDD